MKYGIKSDSQQQPDSFVKFIRTEWQVNRTLRHSDQQYILLSHWKDPNMGPGFTTLAPLAKELQQQYSTLVRNYYRWDGLTSVVSRNNNHFRESIGLGDSTLLSMYGFRLLHGDAQTALKRPFSVALTAAVVRCGIFAANAGEFR